MKDESTNGLSKRREESLEMQGKLYDERDYAGCTGPSKSVAISKCMSAAAVCQGRCMRAESRLPSRSSASRKWSEGKHAPLSFLEGHLSIRNDNSGASNILECIQTIGSFNAFS